MPLSEYEQRVLEQMEQALTSDDPRLANTLQSAERRPVWRYVVGAALVVVGLLVLVLGAASSQWIVGIVGFVLMFGGVVLAVLRPRQRRGPIGVVGGTAAPRPAPRRPQPPSGQGFMSRLEERWERRRNGDGR
ncbi:DUF3040 domain-containing protein [Luteimicrobium subarcticum]|uniref:DUF3040 family protein n=1 Tax=Luteimicrobium subarcticum TaxID=620910 RepID=A0A2M8WTT4_9MICO|nr:DUF3040 domain-containing protein [Luteimicrobium subarcticum]PJI94350.1 Protein of unknown function (DUF3040) [Luteimicrobium subarcticum]